jgi:RND superfamily putative drug exporter
MLLLTGFSRFCYRRRRFVLLGWVALIIALFAISNVAGGKYRTEFGLPGSDTDAANDILTQHGFGSRTGNDGQIVFRADQGVNDPAVRGPIENLLTQIEQQVDGASVTSPYAPDGARQVAADGKLAYASIHFSDRPQEDYTDAADTIRDLGKQVQVQGVELEYGGDMFAKFEMPASELFGIAAAIIILLIAFGSLLAMGLPIVTALFGVGCGVALVGLTTRFLAVPNFTTSTASLLGIGVGIDYALLIVTRFRQGLHDGLEPEDATVTAMNTAGRSVIFAGLTVVIAVLGMYTLNLELIRSVATGAALAVFMTMLASITLLPALLGFAGRNIDKLGLPHAREANNNESNSIWHRWSRLVQRYPWYAVAASVALLVVMTIPLFSMRLGFGDAGNRQTSDTTRRAYDLLAEGFGPGFNGPLIVAAESDGGAIDMGALQALQARLNETPGVSFATPPQPSEDGEAALMVVIPTTAPQDKETSDLVHTLRDDVIPAGLNGAPVNAKLGGVTAASEDFASYVGDRMPLFFAAVLALSFILLMIVFRSIFVPLKAVIVNMLSIGSAFGAMVAVFQWGWGDNLIGVGKEGPIESWVPLMLFAIVFGLSMDYEVFLLSRIREEYDQSNDNASAVAEGLAATARVITAAAAIMVCVFASFILGSDRSLKMFGFGLAFAVFVDATLVRLVLVPATMELLGRANWWLPGWLDRVLPRVNIEAPAARPEREPELAGRR